MDFAVLQSWKQQFIHTDHHAKPKRQDHRRRSHSLLGLQHWMADWRK